MSYVIVHFLFSNHRFASSLPCENAPFHYLLLRALRFTEFGGPIHQRPVQDLAFAVARFIQKGGSFVNYYMVGFL